MYSGGGWIATSTGLGSLPGMSPGCCPDRMLMLMNIIVLFEISKTRQALMLHCCPTG